MRTEPTVAQRFMWIFGLAGLAPFLFHAMFAWVSPVTEVAGVFRSQIHYTAVVLSFIGAVHWGVVLAGATEGSGTVLRLGWGVLPSIFAWVVSLYAAPTALALLSAALVVALVVDLVLYRGGGAPRWWLSLRIVLTAVAAACVALTWLAAGSRAVPN